MKIDEKQKKAYESSIAKMHEELGIAKDYASDRCLSLQYEPDSNDLVAIENDVFGRPQKLTSLAAEQWAKMKKAALIDGIELFMVSAFRSAEYQHKIFQNKLAKGQTMEQILQVNAAPGYSEHHNGNTFDLTTPGSEPLEEEFEKTKAFEWLTTNAAKFGFYLSYPRNNKHRFIYEPWHWTYCS